MKDLWLVLFSIGAGFTASGIVTSLYRLTGFDSESTKGKAVRIAVMVVAGPCMLFESAFKGFRAKKWPSIFFWLATAGAAYWSLAIGLFVIDLAIHM
jgi:hypothetical protein